MKLTRFRLFLATFTLIGLFVGLISQVPNSEAAFGTSPPWVKNDHMLPGTSFEQIVNLSRNETDAPMKATVKISGDKNLVKWIKIENEEKLIMKKGQTILPMKVTVDVPARAAIKNYIGSIYVSLAPTMTDSSLGGGEVAITFGANIDVNITVVGTKITDYQVKSISVDPLQEGSPFSINLEMENLGNTDVSDPKGQIDIYNSAQTEIIKSLTFIPLTEPISPNEIKVSKMTFKDLILDPGEYWVAVKAIKNEKTIYENRLFQEVKAKVVPIITPEDAVKKPALPKVNGTEEKEAVTETLPVTEAPTTEVRSAAPIIVQTNNGMNTVYLIFGLAGFGLALIALVGIIVVLVFVIKGQQRAAFRHDFEQNQTQAKIEGNSTDGQK